MLVSDFDFELPDELVAQEAAPRGESRLLVLSRTNGGLQHATVGDLPRYLRAGDVLVVNNTRVFAARLLGRRDPSGGAVECLLLSRVTPESAGARIEPGTAAMSSTGDLSGSESPDVPPGAGPASEVSGTYQAECWTALVHPGQKLKPGCLMRFEGPDGVLMAEVRARHFHGRRTIRLWAESGGTVEELVDALGHIPLPPYIKRPDAETDRARYQTVYARVRGSVAAPTAGLHFTPELLDALRRSGIAIAEITLHVGYGTFKPVRSETVEGHTVDPEWYDLGGAAAATIRGARREGRRIIAAGTTTTRALEDAALRGGGAVASGSASTSLFIYPGFTFRVIDGLLTNFHLPRSSLLMLVAAFAGRERVLAAYAEAIRQRYRFYSYGDAMLIL